MKKFKYLEQLSEQELNERLSDVLSRMCSMQMFLDRHEGEIEEIDIKAIMCEFKHQSNVYKELLQQSTMRLRRLIK